MTRWSPLPARGGPTTIVESSTLDHTVRALAAPHPVTDIGGCCLPQRRTQDRSGGGQPARPGVLEDVFAVSQPGQTIVRLGLRLPAGGAKDPPADPHQQPGRPPCRRR